MLDVHPPHTPTHTWKDFFIHIATICVGLLIAIGLEQSVEALHHHQERRDLEEQAHVEALHNRALVEEELRVAGEIIDSVSRDREALENAPRSGAAFLVALPAREVKPQAGSSGMLISPSRGTWTVARAAGTISLLPAETAKLYARLDLDAGFEEQAEVAANQARQLALATLARNHLVPGASEPVLLTAAQRDELLFVYTQGVETVRDFRYRLAILEGALDAILADAHSLDEMYAYQNRAIERAHASL